LNAPGFVRAAHFAEIALGAISIVYGCSFFVMKGAVDAVPVFPLMTVRFGMAAVLMLAVFRRHFAAHVDVITIRSGIIAGLLQFGGYALQTIGITMTTSGKSAFLSACFCAILPFSAWLLARKRPSGMDLLSVALCIGGIALTCLGGEGFNAGDLWTLTCAPLFAFQFAYVARAGERVNVWALSCWQMIVMTTCSIVASVVLGQPFAPVLDPSLVPAELFLGVVCSFAYFSIFNYSLTMVEPSVNGLLAALETPTGVLVSVLFEGTMITPRLIFGFVLVALALAVSSVGEKIIGAHGSRGRKAAMRPHDASS